jgi:hypothetical protein
VIRLWSLIVKFPAGGFTVTGVDVVTLSLPNLTVISKAPAAYPQSVTNVPNVPTFSSVLDEGAFVYFYGGAGQPSAADLLQHPEWKPMLAGDYVARATKAQAVSGPWELWTGSGWSTTFAQAAPIRLADGTAHFIQGPGFGVIRYGVGYLMTGKGSLFDWFGPAVNAWYSRNPQGPWHPVAQIVPNVAGTGLQHYGGRVLTNVPGTSQASPLIVYSTNTFPCGGQGEPACTPQTDFAQNVLLYGPKVRRPVNLPTAAQLASQYP